MATRDWLAGLVGGAQVLGNDINQRKAARAAALAKQAEADQAQKNALALIAARAQYEKPDSPQKPMVEWAGTDLMQYDPVKNEWFKANLRSPASPMPAYGGHANDDAEHDVGPVGPADAAMGALTGAPSPLPKLTVTKPAEVKPTPADPLVRRTPIKIKVDGVPTQAMADGRGMFYTPMGDRITGKIEIYEDPTRLPLVTGLGPDGQPMRVVDQPGVKVPTSQTEDKPTTDAERLAAGFAERMGQASTILSQLETDPAFRKTLVGVEGAPSGSGKIPAVGNFTLSPKAQQYKQAQENWVRANLRKESGAAIGKDEMAQEVKIYFPQPGDSDEIISQKAAFRKTAEANMRRNAGRAAQQYSPDNPFAKRP